MSASPIFPNYRPEDRNVSAGRGFATEDKLSGTLEKIDLGYENERFFSEEVLCNPYALFEEARREQPVFKVYQRAFDRYQYVVTTHALVEEVFRDNQRFSSQFNDVLTGGDRAPKEVQEILARSWPEVDTMFTTDEPDHTRLRALAQKAFMPARIARMSQLIEGATHALIDGFAGRGHCDFLKDFAIPLPINSISAIMGISARDWHKLNDWTMAKVRREGQMGSIEQQVKDALLLVECKDYIAKLIEDRKSTPTDDLISDLMGAEFEGRRRFTDYECLATVLLLLVAGAETSRSTLALIMVRLLQNPDVMQRVIDQPDMISDVIEEVLRIDTPAAALWRVTTCDTELGGVPIPSGSLIMMRMDSANRDETVFENGDRFDVQRANIGRHLSFGSGIHYCLGFRLARKQISISMPILLRRISNIRIDQQNTDLRILPAVNTRCMHSLHLTFDQA